MSPAAAVSLDLRAEPAAAALARAEIARYLDHHVPSGVVDDARLLASELVANVVQHAEVDNLHLSAELHPGALHVEVSNPAGGAVPIPRLPELGAGGYGLNMVARMARDWGIEHDGAHTTVWFDLSTSVN